MFESFTDTAKMALMARVVKMVLVILVAVNCMVLFFTISSGDFGSLRYYTMKPATVWESRVTDTQVNGLLALLESSNLTSMVIEETSLPQGKQRSGIEEQDTHKPQNQEWQAGHPEMSSSPTEYRTIEVNQEGPAREIWVADQDCFKLRVRYAKDIDGTLLESFPRSGNTWVRYLLEGATGIFTSSVYRDGTLTKAGGLPKIRQLRIQPGEPCPAEGRVLLNR
ncbi:WSCD family member-like 2 [Homarus americanus]|uniref:WSCD family member-like 2 n=1 Tax=Homarus americanus TaxID=6706 RepID=A0A8J5KFD5_HOMAM|nr:WSCD family member-like 2 [Homarus americanus]